MWKRLCAVLKSFWIKHFEITIFEEYDWEYEPKFPAIDYSINKCSTCNLRWETYDNVCAECFNFHLYQDESIPKYNCNPYQKRNSKQELNNELDKKTNQK